MKNIILWKDLISKIFKPTVNEKKPKIESNAIARWNNHKTKNKTLNSSK